MTEALITTPEAPATAAPVWVRAQLPYTVYAALAKAQGQQAVDSGKRATLAETLVSVLEKALLTPNS